MSNPQATILRKPAELRREDTVLFLIGPTDTGKSKFIDAVTRGSIRRKLFSQRHAPHAVRVLGHPDHHGSLVLVELPGFDGTCTSVLPMIKEWLEQISRTRCTKQAMLYFHRIIDNHVNPRNLKTFEKIVGTQSAAQAFLVTSMWDKVSAGRVKETETREMDLMNTPSGWKELVQYGAKLMRFYNDTESASRILQAISNISNHSKLLLQEELIEGLHLSETQAGQTSYDEFQQRLFLDIQTMRQLCLEADSTEPRLSAELRAIHKRFTREFHQRFDGLTTVPFPRKAIKSLKRIIIWPT